MLGQAIQGDSWLGYITADDYLYLYDQESTRKYRYGPILSGYEGTVVV
jgi:hypothetical protein